MSHTSTISAIKIVDIAALMTAVQELNGMGKNITVLQNVVPKGYSRGQEGMNESAEYVLQIEGADYDVGLYNIGNGQHEARTDFFMGSVARVLGADEAYVKSIDISTVEGREEAEMAQLGLLYQLYAVNATKNTVVNSGGSFEEVIQQDGSIQLTCRAA